MTKVTAVLVFRVHSNANATPVLLGSAIDVSSFSFFQRKSAKEFILFSCRTIAQRTAAGQRQAVAEGEYVVYAYNKDGLCGFAVCDDQYPRATALNVVRKVIDEYDKAVNGRWATISADNLLPVPALDACLRDSQDPKNVDKLAKIQSQIDETKEVVLKSMKSLLDRGQTLEELAAQSDDLGAQSKMFVKHSKELNKCCVVM